MAENEGMLMVQLAQWGAMIRLQDATGAVMGDDYDPETADHRDGAVNTILAWGETLGTMTKHGLISEALVLDWIWAAGLWERVGPAALRAREETGERRLYENFERLALAQISSA